MIKIQKKSKNPKKTYFSIYSKSIFRTNLVLALRSSIANSIINIFPKPDHHSYILKSHSPVLASFLQSYVVLIFLHHILLFSCRSYSLTSFLRLILLFLLRSYVLMFLRRSYVLMFLHLVLMFLHLVLMFLRRSYVLSCSCFVLTFSCSCVVLMFSCSYILFSSCSHVLTSFLRSHVPGSFLCSHVLTSCSHVLTSFLRSHVPASFLCSHVLTSHSHVLTLFLHSYVANSCWKCASFDNIIIIIYFENLNLSISFISPRTPKFNILVWPFMVLPHSEFRCRSKTSKQWSTVTQERKSRCRLPGLRGFFFTGNELAHSQEIFPASITKEIFLEC